MNSWKIIYKREKENHKLKRENLRNSVGGPKKKLKPTAAVFESEAAVDAC